jgi:quinolinate synthase
LDYNNIIEYINSRKKELDAVIIAHYYQQAEIQDIADFVGDSLQLARQAAESKAKVIVCCGVRFMAESAKILSPDKMVIFPEPEAGCPMADMVRAEDIRKMKEQHPNAVVVTYVNTSAEVKAVSDICCTSSNAVKVINSIPEGTEIIFAPDKNLGAWLMAQTGRDMILWDGYCPVHDQLNAAELKEIMQMYPDAKVAVHPECRPEVAELADAVRSTAGLLQYVRDTEAKEFIIGTEEGFLHTLKTNCPDKIIHLARNNFICQDMKQINLDKLALSLEKLETQITLPADILTEARRALESMIASG